MFGNKKKSKKEKERKAAKRADKAAAAADGSDAESDDEPIESAQAEPVIAEVISLDAIPPEPPQLDGVDDVLGSDEEEDSSSGDEESPSTQDTEEKKKKKKKNKPCTCALSKQFPHRAKKCAGIVKGAKYAAVGFLAVGALAASAAMGAEMAKGKEKERSAEALEKTKQAHQDELALKDEEHDAAITELRNEIAGLEVEAAEEKARRLELEATVQETEMALATLGQQISAQRAQLSSFEQEIEAIKEYKRPNFDVVFVLDISG